MPISIVIPTKDRPQGIKAAVRSAIVAQPKGGEIIVVDDGSLTPASKVLSSLSTKLRVFPKPVPNGPSAARNFGAIQASKSIILFLDDDDRLLPDYCIRILEVLNANPDVAFGSSTFFRESVRADGTNVLTPQNPKNRPYGKLDTLTPLRHRVPGTSGLWVKRDVFMSLAGFDEEIQVNEDTEFGIRLARAQAVMWYDHSPGFTVLQRGLPNSPDRGSHSRSLDPAVRVKAYKRILSKHGAFLRENDASLGFRFLWRIWKYSFKAFLPWQ